MKLSLIEIKENYYIVKNDGKQIGWFSKPENRTQFGFVHLRPFAISGNLLMAIGQELNRLNETLNKPKCHLRLL